MNIWDRNKVYSEHYPVRVDKLPNGKCPECNGDMELCIAPHFYSIKLCKECGSKFLFDHDDQRAAQF